MMMIISPRQKAKPEKKNAISRREVAEVEGVQDVDDWIGRGKERRGNHGIIEVVSVHDHYESGEPHQPGNMLCSHPLT